MNKTISTVLLIGALTLSAGPAVAASGKPGDPNCTVVVGSITVAEVPAVYRTVDVPAVTETQYEFRQRNADQHEENGHGATIRWESNPNWNAESNRKSQGWEATGETREAVLTAETTKQELVSEAVPAHEVADNRLECVDVVAAPPASVDVAPPAEDKLESYPAPPPVPNTVNGAVPASLQPTAPVAVEAAQTAETAKPAALANTGASDWLWLWAAVGGLALLAGIASVIRVRRNA